MIGWWPDKHKYGAEYYTPPTKKSSWRGPIFVVVLTMLAALAAGIFLS